MREATVYECNVHDWVQSEIDPRRRELRQAIHTVLLAIGGSHRLRARMLIKGGILLAIRYQGIRYTRDIDFSTESPYHGFHEEKFLEELRNGLLVASNRLEYDMDCRIQSHRIQPGNRPNPSFPTLNLTIGYAPKQDRRRHRQLLAGQASNVVKVDYSFNEVTLEAEDITLTDGGKLKAYSFADLVAEKYRAILQQEVRNRVRGQDMYDLYALLDHVQNISNSEKQKILKSLQTKSESRNLAVDANSLTVTEIVKRSKKGYERLEAEIPAQHPSFNKAYGRIRDFYESLPW